MITIATIIFQLLTVCALLLTIHWQRQTAKELRRAEEIRRAMYHPPQQSRAIEASGFQ
nr:hypothetical protein [Kocuria rhizophila]